MRVAVGVLLGLAFLVGLVFATLDEASVECEVCLDFAGRSACRTVAAGTRDDAIQGAISNACAILAGGVTQGLQCQRTPPRSLRCEGE